LRRDRQIATNAVKTGVESDLGARRDGTAQQDGRRAEHGCEREGLSDIDVITRTDLAQTLHDRAGVDRRDHVGLSQPARQEVHQTFLEVLEVASRRAKRQHGDDVPGSSRYRHRRREGRFGG
jgi:hypothetical protein